MIWDMNIAGKSFYELLAIFFIYSFIGWAWESMLVSLREGRWVNRGFVTGPICTIYGAGALSVQIIYHNYSSNVYLLFFGGMISATIIEYVAACLLDLVFHTSWWDYSVQPLNFQGKICPYATLGWGIVAVLFFRTMQPVVDLFLSFFSKDMIIKASCLVLFIYLVDLGTTGIAAFDLKDKLASLENIYLKEEAIDYSDINVSSGVGGFLSMPAAAAMKVRQKVEMSLVKAGRIRQKLMDQLSLSSFTARRMVRAYPNLKSTTKLARDVVVHQIMRIGKKLKIY